MICPNCKSEYREGFSECADCQIPLIEEFDKPVVPKPDNFNGSDAIEIFQAHDFSDIAFIKSLLESENVGFRFFDETTMSKIWGGIKARLFVNTKDRDKALELLKAAGIL